MEQIDISVIVPVYNVECYLKDCLDSILRQDFKNYEIICVDDASTDQSRKILSDYVRKCKKIKIITHQRNKGLSAARNTGLQNASGKYIMFVDSDDMIIPTSLDELFEIAEITKVDIVCFNYKTIYEKEYKNRQLKVSPWIHHDGIFSGRDFFCRNIENRQLKCGAWTLFIKRSFLNEEKIEFYDGIVHEDILFFFLCMMTAKKVMDINKELYIYRKRKGSITDGNSAMRADSCFVIMVQILSYWNSHKFSERENKSIGYLFREIYNKYLRMKYLKNDSMNLQVGGYVEKTLYSIINEKHGNRWLELNSCQLKKIAEADKVVIFGAGMASRDIINILQDRKIKIDLIVVSNIIDNPPVFCGITVNLLDDVVDYLRDALIIVGVSEKYSAEVENKLKNLKLYNIILPKKIDYIL